MPDGQGSIASPAGSAERARPSDALRLVQIERGLADIALPRTFVSSRNDAMLQRAFTDPTFAAKPPAETPTKEEFLRRLAEIERLGPEAVARDAAAVAFLFGARDTLNAVAAPADAYTIAFTGFYTGGMPELDLLQQRPEFAEMRRQARTSRVAIGALALAGVLSVLLAVAVSVHAMPGKTVLDQVRVTAAAERAYRVRLPQPEDRSRPGAGHGSRSRGDRPGDRGSRPGSARRLHPPPGGLDGDPAAAV